MIGDAVDRGGRNVHRPLYLRDLRRGQHGARALDIGGEDIAGGVEREGRRGVHHEIGALHRQRHHRRVADIALHDAHAIAHIVIGVGGEIERRDLVAAGEEIAGEIDPQKTGAAGDQHPARFCDFLRH